MTVFLDTSALYAVLDRDDRNHGPAADGFRRLLDADDLLTHNYVVLELIALLQHRHGIAAVRTLVDDLLPAATVVWIGDAEHRQAVQALVAAGNRALSLVDMVSFQLMRRRGLTTAFCVDPGFRQQGFAVIPVPHASRP